MCSASSLSHRVLIRQFPSHRCHAWRIGKLGEFAATLTKGAHSEVEGLLSSRERTIETREGNVTIRIFSVRAESIRKLDRAESARESNPS